MAHRLEETICYLSVLFFIIYDWKQEEIFLYIISIFFVNGQTGFVQISHVFILLSFKTNTCARQDLYNREQYHFCPHTELQSTQRGGSSEGL